MPLDLKAHHGSGIISNALISQYADKFITLSHAMDQYAMQEKRAKEKTASVDATLRDIRLRNQELNEQFEILLADQECFTQEPDRLLSLIDTHVVHPWTLHVSEALHDAMGALDAERARLKREQRVWRAQKESLKAERRVLMDGLVVQHTLVVEAGEVFCSTLEELVDIVNSLNSEEQVALYKAVSLLGDPAAAALSFFLEMYDDDDEDSKEDKP